jgi:hypothetical protein
VMVNFVTSCYTPELLMPLVDRITKIPEVVHNWIFSDMMFNPLANHISSRAHVCGTYLGYPMLILMSC